MKVPELAAPVLGDSLKNACTYQLHITVKHDLQLSVGRLGQFDFAAGHYVYTGSAKRNMAARLQRHLAPNKKLYWHIDYLLAVRQAKITRIDLSQVGECIVNQSVIGDILALGFGSSDCRAGCKSHLKFIGYL